MSRLLLAIISICCFLVNGCNPKSTKGNDPSSFLIGTYSCGGFVSWFDSVVYDEYIVARDGRLLVIIKSGDREQFDLDDICVIDKQIPYDTFEAISKILQQNDLRKLKIRESHDVLDGYSRYLVLYDETGDAYKIGGYMPRNETFSELCRMIKSICTDEEEQLISETRRKAEERISEENQNN